MRLEASVGDNMKLNVTQWLIVLMCVLALAGGATAQVSVNAVGADVGVAVGVEAPAGGGAFNRPQPMRAYKLRWRSNGSGRRADRRARRRWSRRRCRQRIQYHH